MFGAAPPTVNAMGIDGVGSSVVIVLAAVMWFFYLVPTWLKRREYLATERNAVRLQQTMRILAESAEIPSVVRVEATARTVAAQQRALRKQQRSAGRAGFPLPAAPRSLGGAADDAGSSPAPFRSASRLRRSRAVASLVLVLSLVAAGVGTWNLIGTGSWVLLAVSSVVAIGALVLLGQAAAVSRARADLRRAVLTPRVASPLHDHADFEERRGAGWRPVPVPKPLYLSRADRDLPLVEGSRSDRLETNRPQITQPDHAELLRVAAAEAERALRAAQAEPEVTRIQRPAASAEQARSAPSRFAGMGVVNATDASPADLDEILRRRRAVG